MIDKGVYPILLIEPQYINDPTVSYTNQGVQRKVRGEPEGVFHCIVLHGYEDDVFHLYDCELKHGPKETLDVSNIRCSAPFTTLQTHCQSLDRWYWFRLLETGEDTTLTRY